MSSSKGIAVVTRTLVYLLDRSARPAVDGTAVRINPPEELKAGTPIINVFLYDVNLTAYQRNQDLPTRDASGAVVNQPTVPLELDYLISFTATANTDEAERLLGATVRTLEEWSVITEAVVEPALKHLGDKTLSVDDLAYPVEVFPVNYDLEQRARLWSSFFQVPYKLSIEYRVRAVVIPGELPVEEPPLPPSRVVVTPQTMRGR